MLLGRSVLKSDIIPTRFFPRDSALELPDQAIFCEPEHLVGMSLLKSNPYLRDPIARQEALRVSAASSSAVEGIRKPFKDAKPATQPLPKLARSGR